MTGIDLEVSKCENIIHTCLLLSYHHHHHHHHRRRHRRRRRRHRRRRHRHHHHCLKFRFLASLRAAKNVSGNPLRVNGLKAI